MNMGEESKVVNTGLGWRFGVLGLRWANLGAGWGRLGGFNMSAGKV